MFPRVNTAAPPPRPILGRGLGDQGRAPASGRNTLLAFAFHPAPAVHPKGTGGYARRLRDHRSDAMDQRRSAVAAAGAEPAIVVDQNRETSLGINLRELVQAVF